MKILHFMAIAFLAGAGHAVAGTPEAQVTESVNKVQYGPSQSSVEAYPAPVGTLVQDGSYVQTGSASRAELRFPTQSIARLGSNTIFNYTASSNQVDLSAGTILFCKPKNAPTQLNIKTEAVTAGITGTTGFVQVQLDKQGKPALFLFGLIEGHAQAFAGGKAFPITSGQFLLVKPGLSPELLNFDVPKLVKTSPLITKFKVLPNEIFITEAVQNYLDDERRGFIQPPASGPGPGFTYDLPGVPPITIDSVQNAEREGSPPSNPNPPSRPNDG